MSALMLRPCPFCGKEAKTYHAFPEFEQGWTIDCDHDDECILRVAHGMFACEETEERAADTWNRRADMPPGYLILSPDEVRRIRDEASRIAELKAELDLLQDILDSRPAINAALPDSYIRWSQAIYSGEAIRSLKGDRDAQ